MDRALVRSAARRHGPARAAVAQGAQRAQRALAALAALLAPLALGGCDDPACVYSGNCYSNGGTGGALGSNPASVPPDNAWLLPNAPVVTKFFPTGSAIATSTPLVVTFSESMSASSLNGSLELIPVGGFGGSVPLAPPALVGDGRMLVLLPAIPLQASASYELRYREDSTVFDLQGTTLAQPADRVIGKFTIAADDGDVPSVVATWPPDGALNQSATGEVVAVFDRRLSSSSVSVDSFVVLVDGVAPSSNPAPQAVLFAGSGVPLADTRAWNWRSTDNNGFAVSLGVSAAVELTLSPPAHPISAQGGGELAEHVTHFDLAAFEAPLSAELVSLPTDAIGIANLNGTIPLELAVELPGAQASDKLGVFLYGQNTSTQGGLAALFREFTVGSLAYDSGTGVATLGEAELDLTESSAPVKARFADGELAIALRLQHAAVVSPVRLVDVDKSDATPQQPLLDTTRPTVVGLSAAGTSPVNLRSDLADLVVVGRASEPLRAAEVSSVLGNNGVQPPVMSFDPPGSNAGLFVAAPVSLGTLPAAQLPLDFSLTVYDRALNAAAQPTLGSFTQLGASGPAPALPGAGTVTVTVFDSASLAAVANAHVFVHQLSGGALTFVDDDFSDGSGLVSLASASSGDTVVSVDALGYDLFTFQGVPTARFDVPLARTAVPVGLTQGALSTVDTTVPTMTKWVSDARVLQFGSNVVPVQSCSFDPLALEFECVWGPAGVLSGPVGMAALVAVVEPPGEFAYAAQSFLKGYSARMPRLPVPVGQSSDLDFQIAQTLDSANVPLEERVLDGPRADLDASATTTLSLANLSGGVPRVSVEARARGMGGALLAGFGAAFASGGNPTDLWRVRCAYPGLFDFDSTSYASDELGQLVRDGIVDPDLFLRAAVVDTLGNASLRRPRFSNLPAPPAVASLTVVDVPRLVAPTAGGNSGALSYDLTFNGVLGAVGSPGLYRAQMAALGGRRWQLWRPSAAGAQLSLRVPNLAADGGSAFTGVISARVAVWAWPSLDVATSFQWSDMAREFDVQAEAAPLSFSVP